MRRIIAVALAIGLLASPVSGKEIETAPTLVIHFSPGGSLFQFTEKYNDIEERGGRVIIDGVCISACTLVLGLVTLDRVCTTSRGVFAFHSASVEGKFSADGTGILWAMMPEQVREFFRQQGWAGPEQEHEHLIFAEATRFVQPCASAIAKRFANKDEQ